MPEITVLSKTPYANVTEKGTLIQATFIVYRDKTGRVGTILVNKAAPSDDDIKRAIEAKAAKK